MFSRPHDKVTHFGLWAEDSVDRLNKQQALAIVKDAVKRTRQEDVRCTELIQALDFLKKQDTRHAPYDNFIKGLSITDPLERFQTLLAAYKKMGQSLEQHKR